MTKREFHAATVLLLLAGPAGSLRAQPAAELEVLSPAPESHVFTNRNVDVMVRILPAPTTQEVYATIGLVATGGPEVPLATGNLLAAPGSDLIQWIWPTAEVQPGSYELVVRLLEPAAGKVSVPVVVHRPPKVALTLGDTADTDEGLKVSVLAEVSAPEGIPIVRYLWTPGDGSPIVETEDPAFEHLYYTYEKSTTVHVEVQNALGGTARASLNWGLKLVPNGWLPALQAPQSGCGCEEMVIHTSDVTHAYCIPLSRADTQRMLTTEDLDERCELAPAGQPSSCPRGQTEIACRLGPEQPDPNEPRSWLRFGFEVDATVTPGSKTDLCLEGQFVQSEFRRDGVVQPQLNTADLPQAGDWSFPGAPGQLPYEMTSVASTPGHPAPTPAFGATDAVGDPLWGADDYDQPRNVKVHQGDQIRWFDAPGLNLTNEQTLGLKADFLSFVGDPDDTDPVCWCHFRIQQEWRRAGGAPAPTIQLIDGLNCELEQPLQSTLQSDGTDPQEARTFQDIGHPSIYSGPPPPTVPSAPNAFTPIRPLVLVPGILGSRLWKQGHGKAHLWGLTHLVWPPLNPLNFKHLNPSRGTPLVADGLVPLVYDGLVSFLDSIGYELSGPQQNLWIYAYDWRQSNDASGKGLKALIDAILSTTQAQQHGWTSVDIVNHSMGGLVTREAKRQGASVTKEIYIASPHVGAPEAYVFVHPAFASQPPSANRPTLFERAVEGASVLHNLRRFIGNRVYRYLRDLAAQMASVYELMPDNHYLGARSMVPNVNGLPDHYYGTNRWQFVRGTLTFSNVRRAMRYKQGLPLPTAGGPTLVIYSSSETTADTVDFTWAQPTFYDSGQKGDVTVPTFSGSLMNAGPAVQTAGTHRRLPNEQAVLQLIRAHLQP